MWSYQDRNKVKEFWDLLVVKVKVSVACSDVHMASVMISMLD